MTTPRRALGAFLFAAAAALGFNRPVLAASFEPPPPIPARPDLERPPDFLLPSQIPFSLSPPDSAAVDGFIGRPQTLPLSCESRSAADWAGFFGIKVDELQFFDALPVSTDPDRGFVGDVRGAWGQLPPNAYGIHAGPVARLLRTYGLTAYYQLYLPWQSIQSEVAANRPVIVWVTGHVEEGRGRLYAAPDGHRTVVAPYEHTVIVIGYDSTNVTLEDGGRRYSRPLAVFLQSWGALRNMAITARP